MNDIASLQAYRARRFPPREFRIDPVMTVFVAVDGVLKALARLEEAGTAPCAEAREHAAAIERARIQQGIDFIFESIDLGAGGLAAGLVFLLMRQLRGGLNSGFAGGQTRFPAETEALRGLHALLSRQIGDDRRHG
jgi:hypothetical protein